MDAAFSAGSFSAGHWGFFCAVIFAAFVVRGFSGFGSSAMCAALLTFIMPPSVAVPFIFMLELFASVALLPGAWRRAEYKWLMPTIAGTIAGIPAGLWLLAKLELHSAQLIVYGLLTFFAAANLLRARGIISPLSLPPFFVGVAAGAANGLAAIAGMVAALFLLASARPAAVVRASLIMLFAVTDIFGLAIAGVAGLWNESFGVLLAAAMIPMLAGVWLGKQFFRGGGERNYRALAMSLILAVALTGLARLLFDFANHQT